MITVGDMLFDMRIVRTYNGKEYEPKPLFSGFEGLVIWNTWDTSDWMVLKTWFENGKYITKELGIIDNNKILPDWNGEDIANFIKNEALKILIFSSIPVPKITAEHVKEQLLTTRIIGPKNKNPKQSISKKNFQKLIEMLTNYINDEILSAIISTQQLNYPIAVDEIIAQYIKIRQEI